MQCIRGQNATPLKRAEKIVTIGNPTYDAKEFPELKDLPDAATEAKEIARLYGPGNSLVLTASAAKEDRILKELKNCDVGHWLCTASSEIIPPGEPPL